MFIPLARPDISQKEIDAVIEVMESGILSIGRKVVEFEKLIASYSERAYGIAVNSGTSALHLTLKALGIKPGDFVITSPFTFISSANVALFEGAVPVFADIDEKTFNISPETLKEALKKYHRKGFKTSAVEYPPFKPRFFVAVDIFGHPLDWDGINEVAAEWRIQIVEDSCEALGSEYKERRLGSFGVAGTFAFYPNKQITTGEGGIVVTDDPEIARLVKSMRNQGRGENETWLEHVRIGYNFRLDEVSAAIGVEQMKRIEEILEKREMVAKRYNELFKNIDGIETPFVDDYVSRMSWFVYVVKLAPEIDRDKVKEYLQKSGVQCREYFKPVHLQPFYRKQFGYEPGIFEVTERVSRRTLAIPFFNSLTFEEQEYVVETMKKAIEFAG